MPLFHGMDITVTRYCVQLSAKQSTVVTIDIEEQGWKCIKLPQQTGLYSNSHWRIIFLRNLMQLVRIKTLNDLIKNWLVFDPTNWIDFAWFSCSIIWNWHMEWEWGFWCFELNSTKFTVLLIIQFGSQHLECESVWTSARHFYQLTTTRTHWHQQLRHMKIALLSCLLYFHSCFLCILSDGFSFCSAVKIVIDLN